MASYIVPQSVFFKLFDTKIVPILMYGCEIWGFQERDNIEIVQRYACKRYMCLNAKTINAAVLGDCGRYSLWIESLKRCINYWLNILKMPNNRYVKKSYLMLKL